MAADHAGAEREKVPLAASGLKHLQGVDANPLEDNGEFVNKGDVEVALAVFNHLGSLGHFDAAGFPGAGPDDAAVKSVNLVGHFGCAATGDLTDGGECVDFVAGIDALGTVAAEKICVEFKTTAFFEHWDAYFFGSARVNRGFINHDVARFKNFAHSFAGFD